MAKKNKPDRKDRKKTSRSTAKTPRETIGRSAGKNIAGTAALEPNRPVWRFLPHLLVTAFGLRALLALSGDFTLHPDETNQYLESAHRLVFGNGITQWEMFYGARSWLLPGFIAGWLKLFEVVGLSQPFWYIGGIKLVFCAVSLLVPLGMYLYGRRHFGETAARVALVAGVFWYEMIGFAHKPILEVLSSAPLMVLLALYVRPGPEKPRDIWLAAFLAVFLSVMRLQYAPVSLLFFMAFFMRTQRKILITVAAAVFFLAFGVFDALTWNSVPFHSYLNNIRLNLNFPFEKFPLNPAYQYILWLVIASAGMGVLCMTAALRNMRRYWLLLAVIAVIVLVHSIFSSHKEYRFIIAIVPLWLLIGSDMLTKLVSRAKHPQRMTGMAAAVFALVSVAGILNALPYQDDVYHSIFGNGKHTVRFLRDQPPIFAAYRYLSGAPDVSGVWQADSPYANTPGYYYLHRKVPFYDTYTGKRIKTVADAYNHVSHIVTRDTNFSIPGYSVIKTFSNRFHNLQILRRDSDQPEVRQWREYTPIFIAPLTRPLTKHINTRGLAPPPDTNIRFADQ